MKFPWSEVEQNIGIAKECDCVGVALCKIDEDGTPIAHHISPRFEYAAAVPNFAPYSVNEIKEFVDNTLLDLAGSVTTFRESCVQKKLKMTSKTMS